MSPGIEEIIKASIDYDPLTGMACWRVDSTRSNSWNSKYPGKIVGSIFTSEHGMQYLRAKICGYNLLVHRIIWFKMTGEWPSLIDHKDGNGLNNIWDNLRVATNSQNKANSRNPKRGIDPFPNGKWRAKICVEGEQIHLGMFNSKDEAYSAYEKALKEFHGEFAIYNREY